MAPNVTKVGKKQEGLWVGGIYGLHRVNIICLHAIGYTAVTSDAWCKGGWEMGLSVPRKKGNEFGDQPVLLPHGFQ